uniref:Uncharacterized protein n=1 Tax=Timema tahoe TaxID=61484 RepID=A0A7R9IEB9_9NEOP|nr:unnamed protein product [Timema tahoe]
MDIHPCLEARYRHTDGQCMVLRPEDGYPPFLGGLLQIDRQTVYDADRRTVCGAQRVRTVKQQTPPSESSRPDRRAARLDWPVPSHWTGLNSLVFSWSLGARAATVLLIRAGVSSHPHRTLDLLTAGQQILTSLDLSNITITININITTNITSTTTTTSTTTSTSTTTTTTTTTTIVCWLLL